MRNENFIFTPKFIHKPWGGDRLNGQIGVGEAFLVSDFDDYNFSTKSQGKTIKDLIDFYGMEFLGSQITQKYSKKLPVYLKELDTKSDLSVQVHPDDNLAFELENENFGKDEAWYIRDSKEESGIYLGLKEGVTSESLQKALKDKADISKLLNFIRVSPGDFFYIPAGLVHAIGKDINLLEPQQNSNRTYRIWDWNYKDENGNPRELHVEKALKVINFDPGFNLKYSKKIIPQNNILFESPKFNVYLNEIQNNEFELNIYNTYQILTLVSGQVEICFNRNKFFSFTPGRACLVPAFVDKTIIKPKICSKLMSITPNI